MKRLIVISGLSLLSLGLTGCQWFQAPTTEEALTPVSETSTATVTIEESTQTTTSTGTVEILPADGDATVESGGSITVQ